MEAQQSPNEKAFNNISIGVELCFFTQSVGHTRLIIRATMVQSGGWRGVDKSFMCHTSFMRAIISQQCRATSRHLENGVALYQNKTAKIKFWLSWLGGSDLICGGIQWVLAMSVLVMESLIAWKWGERTPRRGGKQEIYKTWNDLRGEMSPTWAVFLLM